MRFERFLTLLGDRTDFDYQGSTEGAFRGVAFGRRPPKTRRQFLGIVEDDWGEFSSSRYSLPDERLEEITTRAIAEGARGMVLPRRFKGAEFLEGVDCFFVDSTLAFGMDVARMVLSRRGRSRITAITGSVGKSSTKAMLGHALRGALPERQVDAAKIANTPVPVIGRLTRTRKVQQSVIEVAGSTLHMFREHGFSVNADVAIVTSIADAHLQFHGTMEQVAGDKAEIFTDPPAGGTAVINLDAPFSEELVRRATREGRQLVTYGRDPGATIRLTDYDLTTGHVVAEIGHEQITYTVGARGEHMALNSLAVLATLRAYRLPKWRDGIAALETFEPVDGRGSMTNVSVSEDVTVTLIDESFNANPASVRASLATFAGTAGTHGGRKVAILGDMLELAEATEAAHRGLADVVQAVEFDEVHLVGEHMAHLRAELHDREGLYYWENVDALIVELPSHLRDGDVVLAKASRSTGLFHALKRLVEPQKTGIAGVLSRLTRSSGSRSS